MRLLVAILIAVSFIPVFSQSIISFDVDADQFTPGEIVELDGKIDTGLEGQLVSIEIKDGGGNVILIRTVTTEQNGEFTLKFKIPENAEPGEFGIVANMEIDGDAFSETKTIKSSDNQVVIASAESEEDLMAYLPYVGIAAAVIIGVIVAFRLKNKESDELSEDYEYEESSIIQEGEMSQKFKKMQTGSDTESFENSQVDQLILDKVRRISELQENKIGDYDKLEQIKNGLIKDSKFTAEDNAYLEERFREYGESKDKK